MKRPLNRKQLLIGLAIVACVYAGWGFFLSPQTISRDELKFTLSADRRHLTVSKDTESRDALLIPNDEFAEFRRGSRRWRLDGDEIIGHPEIDKRRLPGLSDVITLRDGVSAEFDLNPPRGAELVILGGAYFREEVRRLAQTEGVHIWSTDGEIRFH